MPFITDDGELAVALVSLSLDWMAVHLDEIQRPPGSVITLTDADGTMLARLPPDPARTGKPGARSAAPAGAAAAAGHRGGRPTATG